MMAQQEALGDLKLYRIPEPVTVAAHSQKQVALLAAAAVQVRTVYRQRHGGGRPLSRRCRPNGFLITRNRARGRARPAVAGRPADRCSAQASGRRCLLGQATIADRAVGEDVEIDFGDGAGRPRYAAPPAGETDGKFGDYELVVTNDRRRRRSPMRLELDVPGLRLHRGDRAWPPQRPGRSGRRRSARQRQRDPALPCRRP